MLKKRVTLHSQKGRKGKGFDASHSDRTNTSTAEHIIKEDSVNNKYWTHDGEYDFTKSEMSFYETNSRASLDAKNLRYLASRHDERCQAMIEYYRSQKTCPDESLLYIGQKGNTVDAEKLWNLALEYKDWIANTYPNYKPLSMALHCDEQGAPHIHFRAVFVGHDKDNNLIVGMEKALREMGIERPAPAEREGRFNNRKMVFTALCREKFQSLAKAAGIEIETETKEKSKTGLTLAAYQTRQEEEKASVMREQRKADEKRLETIAKRVDEAIEQEKVMDHEGRRLKGIKSRAKKVSTGIMGLGDEVIQISPKDYVDLQRMAAATAKAEKMAKQEAEARKNAEEKTNWKLEEADARVKKVKLQLKETQEVLEQNAQAMADYSAMMAVWEFAPVDVQDQLIREAEIRAEVSDEINRIAARAGKLFKNEEAAKVMQKALDYIGISQREHGNYIRACVRASERKGPPIGGRSVGWWHNEPMQTDYSVSPSTLPQWLVDTVTPLIVPPPTGSHDETYGTTWEWLSTMEKDEIINKTVYQDY